MHYTCTQTAEREREILFPRTKKQAIFAIALLSLPRGEADATLDAYGEVISTLIQTIHAVVLLTDYISFMN